MPNFSGVWTLSQQFQGQGQGLWPKVPGAPTIGTASAASATSISVAFTAPACAGYPPISSYTATSTPGCFTGTATSSPIIVSGLTTGTSYTFKVKAQNGAGFSPCSASSNSAIPVAPGSQSYTSSGTYTWVAPTGVTSVSVVAVGGGGGGAWLSGGGGGGLGWRNNIPVTPGNSYTVVVGAGGSPTSAQFGNPGTGSYFSNVCLVYGGPGQGSTSNVGGSYNGQGGGNGGNGGYNSGGGGAGGYSGGGGFNPSTSSNAGTGGAGGKGGVGGVCSFSYCCCGYYYGQTYVNSSAGGGGVGLLGQGGNGAAGTNGVYCNSVATGGGGGSGGANGSNATALKGTGGSGGAYGGGGGPGGYCYNTNSSYFRFGTGGAGGSGAVRIVWPGGGRQFPSTCVGNP